MTKYRELTEEERKVTENQLKKLEDQNRKLQIKAENIDFFLSRFLPMEYEEKVEKYKESKKFLVEDIMQNTNTITILKTQLSRGVEVKKKEDGDVKEYTG